MTLKLTTDQIFQKAFTAHKEGKLEEAEHLYREILKIDPTHPDVNHNLGTLLVYLDKISAALPLFKIATEVNPNIGQFWISYGNALIKENKFKEAEISFRKVIELKQDYPEAHFNLANLLNSLRKFKDAEISYRKVIELKPDYTDAYYNFGNMLIKIGKIDEAIINIKKAIELEPDYAEAHNSLGAALRKFANFEDAELSFKKAIELNPEYAEAYNNLGNVIHKLKRLDEAEKNYRKAIKLNPNFAEAHNNLGTVLQDNGKIYDAEASYKKAIELNPNFRAALLNRGQILFDKSKFELSLKDFDACNTKDSRSRAMVSLYALGRIEEIYQRIETQKDLDLTNIRVAAFSSFISAKEKKKTTHKFCPNPLDFMDFTNLVANFTNPKPLISELVDDLSNIKTKWEPSGMSIYNGFQTSANLFTNPSGKLSILKSIIMEEINFYFLKFNNKNCAYIKLWPIKSDLFASCIRLKKQGYQGLHIQPSGWLSGVIYLKVVQEYENNNEGAIEFSLNGKYYSDPNTPKLIHQPKEGDIIFFPSSLHHRTIPFKTETDCISIAFDLIPLT